MIVSALWKCKRPELTVHRKCKRWTSLTQSLGPPAPNEVGVRNLEILYIPSMLLEAGRQSNTTTFTSRTNVWKNWRLQMNLEPLTSRYLENQLCVVVACSYLLAAIDSSTRCLQLFTFCSIINIVSKQRSVFSQFDGPGRHVGTYDRQTDRWSRL